MKKCVCGSDIIYAIEFMNLEDHVLNRVEFDEIEGVLTLVFYHAQCHEVRNDDDTVINETRIKVIIKDGTCNFEPIVFNFKDSREFLNRISEIKSRFPEIEERDIINLIDPDMSVYEYRKAVAKAKADVYEDEREKVLRLYRKGFTCRYIAEELGFSESKVRTLLKSKNSPTFVFGR